MAIADFVTYLAKVANPHQRIYTQKASQAGFKAAYPVSLFQVAPDGGAIPTSAVVPSRTIAGALGQGDPATTLRIARVEMANANGGMLMLYDRLSHQGGLSGTTTGAQTTNLPTAALTRYTSGVGVMAALEIYTAVGTTATTATCSYTNSASTSGQTSQAIVFGSSGFQEANTFKMVSLAQGDLGVQAVASVTLAASTVSAAGNFGVTLMKPLALIPMQNLVDDQVWDAVLNGCANLAQVQTGACLCLAATPVSTTTYGAFLGQVLLIEE